MPAVGPLAVALGAAVALTACATSTRPQARVAPPAPATPSPSPSPSPAPVVVASGDGRLAVVAGGTPPAGTGQRTSYVVEVEGGLGVDPREFAAAVDRTLADPRSWSARRVLQRVDDRQQADLRVALASPRTVDRLCAPLRTGGYFSCAHGDRAVLNVARWLLGAPSYPGRLQDYRAYVVNHEVGHTLGFGHARCPGDGQPAPVMLQQTKSLDGCLPGPWPYP